MKDDFELLVSGHILREVLNTLVKPYFVEHVDIEVSREMLEALAEHATHVRITHAVSGVASHPDDDHVLEAALSAGADYLVTGDGPFQRVKLYGGVAIESPRTFLEILGDS